MRIGDQRHVLSTDCSCSMCVCVVYKNNDIATPFNPRENESTDDRLIENGRSGSSDPFLSPPSPRRCVPVPSTHLLHFISFTVWCHHHPIMNVIHVYVCGQRGSTLARLDTFPTDEKDRRDRISVIIGDRQCRRIHKYDSKMCTARIGCHPPAEIDKEPRLCCCQNGEKTE